MRIEKKAWPEFFEKITSGEKTFDLRLGDFKCKPEDTLILKELDPQKQVYTGRTIEKKVMYVLKTKNLSFWTKEDVEKHGFQIISLK